MFRGSQTLIHRFERGDVLGNPALLRGRGAPEGTGKPEPVWSWFYERDSRLFELTGLALGFTPQSQPGTDLLDIGHAGNMEADTSLKHKRIMIRLDKLFAGDYPGGGRHQVLVDFFTEHQIGAGEKTLLKHCPPSRSGGLRNRIPRLSWPRRWGERRRLSTYDHQCRERH